MIRLKFPLSLKKTININYLCIFAGLLLAVNLAKANTQVTVQDAQVALDGLASLKGPKDRKFALKALADLEFHLSGNQRWIEKDCRKTLGQMISDARNQVYQGRFKNVAEKAKQLRSEQVSWVAKCARSL